MLNTAGYLFGPPLATTHFKVHSAHHNANGVSDARCMQQILYTICHNCKTTYTCLYCFFHLRQLIKKIGKMLWRRVKCYVQHRNKYFASDQLTFNCWPLYLDIPTTLSPMVRVLWTVTIALQQKTKKWPLNFSWRLRLLIPT